MIERADDDMGWSPRSVRQHDVAGGSGYSGSHRGANPRETRRPAQARHGVLRCTSLLSVVSTSRRTQRTWRQSATGWPITSWGSPATPRHNSLDAPETLHDAWLERVQVSESDADGARGVALEVRLLGAFRDRAHVLRYSGVRRYEVAGAGVARGHGDLYAHEVRLAEDGTALVHEVRFAGPPGSGDSRLIVECADLRQVVDGYTPFSGGFALTRAQLGLALRLGRTGR